MKSTFGICKDHRLQLWFVLSAVWARPTSTPRASLQARSGFVCCQRGRRFSHCKDSAGSRTVGCIRMSLLTHDSVWQQPQLPRSAVNLGRGLNDSCGHAGLSQCSLNAALTTAGWHHNLVWTLVPRGNQSQESDPKCGEKDSWNNNSGQRNTHSCCTNNKDANVGCVETNMDKAVSNPVSVDSVLYPFTQRWLTYQSDKMLACRLM